ncbi:erythromycin esterase family protein [Amycolatopsis magusensis]|uniref:erythromycin esterase family protein n=1 Tax=Amycolatopsis magusensis TaxID=882444 RepID=UPI003C2C17A0
MTPWLDAVTRDGLAALGARAAAADVVALGVSCRGAHELSGMADEMVRYLVREHGFRAVLLEGDEAASVLLDEYVRTGDGDPRRVLGGARSFLRAEEVLGTIRWLRSYNEEHPDDPVRVVHPRKEPGVPASREGIERMLADSVTQWRDRNPAKLVYWGGIAHTAPGDVPTAGRLLRERCSYLSVGLTFHHGEPRDWLPVLPEDFLEATLDRAKAETFLLDLRETPAAWADAPARTRLVGPRYDPAHDYLEGTPAGWFDLVRHTRRVTPARLFA